MPNTPTKEDGGARVMGEMENGGPAFSGPTGATPGTTWPGMSIRDWFAGQALAGMMANAAMQAFVASHVEGEHQAKFIGALAYVMADGMLSARKSTEGGGDV